MLRQIKDRHAALVAEAAADRSAARKMPARAYRVSGLRLQFGDLLIVIGRTLCEDDARAYGPAR